MILDWLFPNRRPTNRNVSGPSPSKVTAAKDSKEIAIIYDNIGPPIISQYVDFFRESEDFEYIGCYEVNSVVYHRFEFISQAPP